MNSEGIMEDISHTIMPNSLENIQDWINEPTEYFLPPAAFSRVDSMSLNVIFISLN